MDQKDISIVTVQSLINIEAMLRTNEIATGKLLALLEKSDADEKVKKLAETTAAFVSSLKANLEQQYE